MTEEKNEGIVVKVQQSLQSSNGKKSVLIYDQNRIIFVSSEDPGIVTPLCGKLGDDPKGYFKAMIENQEVKIFGRVENQNW